MTDNDIIRTRQLHPPPRPRKKQMAEYTITAIRNLLLQADDAMTARDIAQAMDVSLGTVRNALKRLRDQDLAHIAEWVQTSSKRPAAAYRGVPGTDAPPPQYTARRKALQQETKAAAREAFSTMIPNPFSQLMNWMRK